MKANQNELIFREVVDREEPDRVEVLAREIWTQHYTPIIGEPQVEYMLENFQTSTAVREQIRMGMTYFLMEYENVDVGYLAFEKKNGELFLSKIYVLPSYQGRGIGRLAMSFVSNRAEVMGCDRLSLTVNKNNTRSIGAYEKMGFENKGPCTMDIGNGFVMDDYLMEKRLARE